MKKINFNKKYILTFAVGIVFYIGLKIFVTLTPTPLDDNLPDQAKDIVLKFITVDGDDTGVYDDEDLIQA